MFKRLTAILLLLALAAGVASGAPLHSGKDECDMGGAMEEMDCCKRARMQGDTPEILAARLCCAVNCQNGGTTGAAHATRVTPPQQAPSHPASAPSPFLLTVLREPRRDLPARPNESPPVYLLHLALLI